MPVSGESSRRSALALQREWSFDVSPSLSFAGLTLDRPRLMGIVNVTPDSFSDAGESFDPGRAIASGIALSADGANIIDVGGESSRPGATGVDIAEEQRRIRPVVRGLVRAGILVSIDTRHAETMRIAIGEGARIVNDVSALRDDPAAIGVVAEARAPVILMHRRGTAPDRYRGRAYGDVTAEVKAFLLQRVEACLAAGIARQDIAIDPGIGFGKTVDENLHLILATSEFTASGLPVMIGASRKGFIGRLTGVDEARLRLGGSIAVALQAARHGARLLRVHDVAATHQALKLQQAFSVVENGGSAFPPV